MSVCVRVCIWLFVDAHDSTAVSVCLSGQQISGFSPSHIPLSAQTASTYQAQSSLMRQHAYAVYSTHTHRYTGKPQASFSARTQTKRHTETLSHKRIHTVSSWTWPFFLIGLATLASLLPLLCFWLCLADTSHLSPTVFSFPLCFPFPYPVFNLDFSVYLSTRVDAVTLNWRSLLMHVCVLPLLLLSSE